MLFAGALTGFHLFGYPRRFLNRANRALVFFYSLLFPSVMTDVCFCGCSHRFPPVRVPAQVSKPRKPRTCFFRSLHSPSVTTDVRFPRVLSQVFTCSGTRANSITAQTAHLFFSLSSVPVGYDRRSLSAGALTGFHLFGYPREFLNRAKPRTCSFCSLLFLSVRTDVCFLRVLSQVFTCSGTRAGSITALNRPLTNISSKFFFHGQ